MTALVAHAGATTGDGIVMIGSAIMVVGCAWAFFWFLKGM